MISKKIAAIILSLILSFSFLNSLVIVKDTDEVDKAYVQATFGKGIKASSFKAEQMILTEFNEFKKYAMQDAAYGKNYTDAERQGLMQKLKAMKFTPMKMVFFQISAQEPLLPQDLKFNVKLLNAKSESLAVFDYYQSFIVTRSVSFGFGVTNITYYTYTWIIEADKQLIKKNYTEEEMPVKILVEFPNGQKRTFKAVM